MPAEGTRSAVTLPLSVPPLSALAHLLLRLLRRGTGAYGFTTLHRRYCRRWFTWPATRLAITPYGTQGHPLRGRYPKLARLRRLDCRRDRKSTRLNSSHVAISYAVFCLKKKQSS